MCMAARFKNIDRHTPMLLPPDLREWVAEDDLVHFVIEAVERLPLSAFAVNHKGCGDEQFPPHLMLALLIYCYANGLFGSRRIERATYRDVAVRSLCADHHPDHDRGGGARDKWRQAMGEPRSAPSAATTWRRWPVRLWMCSSWPANSSCSSSAA